MKKLLTNAYVKCSNALFNAKTSVKRLAHEEKGGAEIIATIILVAIVVLLALFFREQIGSLVSSIWGSITGQSEQITASFSAGGGAQG